MMTPAAADEDDDEKSAADELKDEAAAGAPEDEDEDEHTPEFAVHVQPLVKKGNAGEKPLTRGLPASQVSDAAPVLSVCTKNFSCPSALSNSVKGGML